MNFSSIRALFLTMKISNQALREYRASSVDRALCEEALTLLTLLLRYLLDTYLDSIVLTFSLLFRSKLQCQMEKNKDFLWKNYNVLLNSPRGWSTCRRIQYKSVDCFLRYLICRYHVPDQKWVRKRNICTLRISGFGIVSASQDRILWRCKEKKQKLCWLKNKHKDLKWKDLAALETMRMRKKFMMITIKSDYFYLPN